MCIHFISKSSSFYPNGNHPNRSHGRVVSGGDLRNLKYQVVILHDATKDRVGCVCTGFKPVQKRIIFGVFASGVPKKESREASSGEKSHPSLACLLKHKRARRCLSRTSHINEELTTPRIGMASIRHGKCPC